MTPRRLTAALAALVAFSLTAAAAPVSYALQADRSVVAFETDYGDQGLKIRGRMPVLKADLVLDFDAVANSSVTVSVDAAGSTTSNPLATEAMLGRTVLDTRAYPTIDFQSTGVRRNGDGAKVTGNLTVRGVTRPVTFDAVIYRQKGTEAGDRSNLSILLTGAISRSAFGASGFADLVGDEVRLRILARITRAD
ncbi:MAG: YceI family protein [Rhodobacteraceae bacterium]|nr:YceI family protein [Paracoccaceae bacterium]